MPRQAATRRSRAGARNLAGGGADRRRAIDAAESLCRAVLLTGGAADEEHARAEATLARVLLWQGRIDEAADLPLSIRPVANDASPFVEATAVRVLLEQARISKRGSGRGAC